MTRVKTAFAALLLAAHIGVISCDEDDDAILFADDVRVEISGAAGTGFDAFFEDDERAQSLSGTVPATLDFVDQIGFFRAIVDKDSSGSEEICVRVTATHDSEESCTTDPFGRVSVAVFF